MSRRKAEGFTLIELLIALVVLAIGLLGMATLMMASLQTSQGASQRSAATVAAYDLVERMRTNRTAAVSANSPYTTAPATVDLPASDCFAHDSDEGCSADEMAEFDLATWWSDVQTAIPGSDVAIQQVAGSNETFCIVIFWQEPGVANTDSQGATPCGQDPVGRAFYRLQVTL